MIEQSNPSLKYRPHPLEQIQSFGYIGKVFQAVASFFHFDSFVHKIIAKHQEAESKRIEELKDREIKVIQFDFELAPLQYQNHPLYEIKNFMVEPFGKALSNFADDLSIFKMEFKGVLYRVNREILDQAPNKIFDKTNSTLVIARKVNEQYHRFTFEKI